MANGRAIRDSSHCLYPVCVSQDTGPSSYLLLAEVAGGPAEGDDLGVLHAPDGALVDLAHPHFACDDDQIGPGQEPDGAQQAADPLPTGDRRHRHAIYREQAHSLLSTTSD